jgi:hypothetical protein
VLAAPPGYVAALTSGNVKVCTLCTSTTGDGTRSKEVRVLGGLVTADRAAAIRRQCNLQVRPDPELIPVGQPTDLLSAYGSELTLYRGIVIPGYVSPLDGSAEFLAPLGVFRVATVLSVDDGAPTLDVTGYDRSWVIARNLFADPYTVPAGTNYVTAIVALANDRMPGVVCVTGSTTEVTPLLTFDSNSDPWAHLTEMATAIGMEVYFDLYGQLQVQPERDPSLDPVAWGYAEGQGGLLVRVSKTHTAEPGYNGVVMTAQNTSLAAPLRVTVWDANPASPTYYLGPYGQAPMFVDNPYAVTLAQLTSAANSVLSRQLGVTETLVLDVVPNTVHRLGDTLQVQRAAVAVDSNYSIEAMTVPLQSDALMQVTLRQRRANAA